VREALFSALVSRDAVGGARVADLYAGTGALGLEALSRGAATVTFVENSPAALDALRANIAALGAGGEVTAVRADVTAWLRRAPAGAFDLVLADPPYDAPELPRLPERALRLLAPGGTLAVEHDTRHSFDDAAWSRRYGRTMVSLWVVE